jgi:hypothetical protein
MLLNSSKLLEMLEFRLKSFSEETNLFAQKYFGDLSGPDDFYNYMGIVGDNPKVVFMCQYNSNSAKYPGKNSLKLENGRISQEDDFRNSVNGFTEVVSAYIMLELMERKVPGIYFFLGDDKSTTETFWLAGSPIKYSAQWEVAKLADYAIYFGKTEFTEFQYTSAGHRMCSDEFKHQISEYFGLKAVLEYGDGDSLITFNVSEFAEYVPECVVMPVGVKHPYGAKVWTEDLLKEVYVDLNSVAKIIELTANCDWENFSVKRTPSCFSEFVGFEESFGNSQNPSHKPSQNSGFFSWLGKLFS